MLNASILTITIVLLAIFLIALLFNFAVFDFQHVPIEHNSTFNSIPKSNEIPAISQTVGNLSSEQCLFIDLQVNVSATVQTDTEGLEQNLGFPEISALVRYAFQEETGRLQIDSLNNKQLFNVTQSLIGIFGQEVRFMEQNATRSVVWSLTPVYERSYESDNCPEPGRSLEGLFPFSIPYPSCLRIHSIFPNGTAIIEYGNQFISLEGGEGWIYNESKSKEYSTELHNLTINFTTTHSIVNYGLLKKENIVFGE